MSYGLKIVGKKKTPKDWEKFSVFWTKQTKRT